MGKMYIDSETCGLCGPAVLIQWSDDEAKTIHLHEVWTTPIIETLQLIEKIVYNPDGIVGFNLTFDHFQLCKLYTMLFLYKDHNAYPEDIIEELAELEPLARDGKCLKPVSACDLMLVARKGPYQSTMNRAPIRIRRVPTALAWQLAAELERRVPLSDIYFARRKNQFAEHFKVHDIKDSEGEINPDFKDIVLNFAPSAALKVLVADALKIPTDDILLFADIEIDEKLLPVEHLFAPFAKAVGEKGSWNGAWPDVIKYHINHWAYNTLARKYAAKDVEYLPQLYSFFGSPEMGDDDSTLACMVAAVRWRGFATDIEGIKELREKALERKRKTPTAPEPVRRYINQVIDNTERVAMAGSTKKVLLEEIVKWQLDCPECGGETIIEQAEYEEEDELWEDFEDFDPEPESEKTGCATCQGKGSIPHPAAARAKEVLDARAAGKEIELYDKLLLAGRLHADMSIIGAKSSRMSGAGKLNAQGIKRDEFVREKFPLTFGGMQLVGGDFESFEVVLADAEYNDENLRQDLLSGKKIHGLFGVFLYPPHTYEEILASAKQPNDMYTPSKSGVFAIIYGGDFNTLKKRLGIPIEIGERAFQHFCRRYPGVGIARQKVINAFMTMRQREQYGKIEWSEPDEYVETLFGFRRYFTVEHQIEKALYNLAMSPPKSWQKISSEKVWRSDREQTAFGALQSALFAAAFNLQSSNMRAAANHRIQGSGAQITKYVERKIWEIQPAGIEDWCVQPINVHDEIQCPTAPAYVDQVREVVIEAVEHFRDRVPLISMKWKDNLKNWAG